MKIQTIIFALLVFWGKSLSSQSVALYDDQKLASIYLELPADSLNSMIATLEHNRYTPARFVFDDGQERDTVETVGLRLRGNTSLFSQKKSFKISFNEFKAGREYQGVKKLNLLGQHNDPTMVREKLFYEVWNKAGMTERRAAFVRLYINMEYRGLYTNMEELDKNWLDRVYGDDSGNLYKCTYPADLVYHGPVQQVYKDILNNPEERAYDLKTNELADDYTHLIALMAALDQPVTANFPAQISQILNVESVLKSFAIDVATGNWDDYFYNKNNYFLYDNPTTGRFEFTTYDTDNTLGVDWLGKDWAKRNCLAWLPSGQSRPLATKLLAVPAFKAQYVRYLDTLTRFITLPDSIFSSIDALETLVSTAALDDPYRSLDYGYTFADFHNGFDQTIDGHTPYGIKPFLSIRHDSIRSQIMGVLSKATAPDAGIMVFQGYPNPVIDQLFVQTTPAFFPEKMVASIYSVTGQLVERREWDAAETLHSWAVNNFATGVYVLHLQSGIQEGRFVFLKAGH